MASGHSLILAQHLLTGAAEGLTDADGNELAPFNLADLEGPLEGYSKPFLLSPKAEDVIFTAICKGCAVKVTLQMSPDGVNWCNCVLVDGSNCTVECNQPEEITPQGCYAKTVDVSVLQYVRFHIYDVGSSSGDCTIMLNFTLN